MKIFSFLKIGLSLAGLVLILLINGCSPVFSDMQDARTVGKNNMDVTAGFSSVSFRDTDEKATFKSNNHIGFQGAYGITDRVDARLRFERIWFPSDDTQGESFNVVGIGPKASIIENRLSAYIPIGFAFGGEVDEIKDTWQIHPTILATFPVNEKLDINPSFKVLIPLAKDNDTDVLTALNIGVGIKVIDNFIFRPEFGMLFNPGEDGYFTQLSLGVTYAPSSFSDRD